MLIHKHWYLWRLVKENFLSDDISPTPASIAKGIMEDNMTPYASKRIYSLRKLLLNRFLDGLNKIGE